MRRPFLAAGAALRSLAHKLGSAAAEYHDAERRVAALRDNPDMYVFAPQAAPDTFEEFLFRTSGPLLHEPAAALRNGASRG